ncbi:hypothetical protein AA21952_1653 [Acetobacter oeni LMG 21952]|nr:hypothetical protein AA21952_1653 [Acetobacter oeni LMG 21952]
MHELRRHDLFSGNSAGLLPGYPLHFTAPAAIYIKKNDFSLPLSLNFKQTEHGRIRLKRGFDRRNLPRRDNKYNRPEKSAQPPRTRLKQRQHLSGDRRSHHTAGTGGPMRCPHLPDSVSRSDG